MPRKPKTIPGPSRLSQILVELTKAPRPSLTNLKGLKVTLATKNDHFGARHFLKTDLPRIRYANPNLAIEVNKVPKTKEDTWKPEMVLELRDGTSQTLDLSNKWSSAIFQEVMDIGGSASWERWKRERTEAGLPIVDAPEPKASPKEELLPFRPNTSKTGAAAVLP